MCEYHVGPQGDQLFGQRLRLGAGGRKTNIDADIAALRPSEPLELLSKFHDARLGFRIVLGQAHQHPDAPHCLRLLRARRERPSDGSAAEERDERAPLHSITSSASASSLSGIWRSSAWAVMRSMASPNFVRC